MTLTLIDFFCGAGGSSQGATAVPGVTARLAANHWSRAIETHALNFPGTEHYQGDLHDVNVARLPAGDLFWASPECPTWSQARGQRRDYDKQPDLFGEILPDEATDRSRALMWDVPRYLDAMALRGAPVLAGVVENVTDVRAWVRWDAWVAAIRGLGYRTRLIAINSMHARPRVTPYAPQSRDRLYLAYWAVSLGRDPDWDRWLRPLAWCPSCEEDVAAVQWWKRPGADMGRYRQQYLYRCPRISCRGQAVEPGALPAAAAIDWGLPGTRIGDRNRPLSPKTLARITAGFARYARPITLEAAGNTFERRPGVRAWPAGGPPTTQTATATTGVAVPPVLVPAGGTWRADGTSAAEPMPARTCRENDGIAVPPFLTIHRGGPGDTRTRAPGEPVSTIAASGNHLGLVAPPFLTIMRGKSGDQAAGEPLGTVTATDHHGLVTQPLLIPVEGRGGKEAVPVTGPGRTQTARAETGIAVPPAAGYVPLALLMRNNTPRSNPAQMCTPVTEPARTLTTTGHQSLVGWAHLLVPYYQTGVARPVTDPVGTLTARDRYALVSATFDIADALFRMLEPHEISAAMAFTAGYRVLGSKREKVRQLGNAVTPPVAEVLIAALTEAITGEVLP